MSGDGKRVMGTIKLFRAGDLTLHADGTWSGDVTSFVSPKTLEVYSDRFREAGPSGGAWWVRTLEHVARLMGGKAEYEPLPETPEGLVY